MNKFTKRIAWTAYIAMMYAFFVWSMTSAVMAADPGFAKGSAEASPDNATLDYDGDGLSNLAEWYNGTDPSRADTDNDGWPDAVDNEISRARLDFNPLFIDGDSFSYFWPAWMVAAFKTGGEWEPILPAWYVPVGANGKLCLIVNRSILASDVVLELEFYDAPNASLFVDLVNNSGEVLISSEFVGNSDRDRAGLVDGSGTIVRKSLNIPLENYPEAVGIYLRGTGEIFLFEVSLFIDLDNDGLDENQEAVLRTSDLIYDEVFVYGTNPAKRGTSPTAETIFTGRANPQGEPNQSSNMLSSPVNGRTRREFRTAKIKSITIPQFVMARLTGAQSWMGGQNFMITRSVIDGGGTRQSGGALILEDTVAQPSAIGFSTGSVIMLHAGYQQTEECILPEILNVGVIPDRFNPYLGEIATLSYVLNVDSPNVTVEVWKGLVTNTVVSAQYQPAGLNSIVWLGTNEDGTLVTPGPWSFTISAACNGQTTSVVAQVRVVNNIPVILDVHDEPDIFCPAQGAAKIYYTTDEKNDKDLDVRISLEDAAGNLVTDITYDDQPVGTHTQTWDGSDAPNFGTGTNYQPNGLYIYRINASRPGQQANEKSGVVVLACGTVATNMDNIVELRYRPDSFTVEITRPTGSQLTDANFALITADPSLFQQSPIYEIKATPETTFDPPALLTFKYSPAISGDIDDKLQIRRYDPVADEWVVIPRQAVDFVNNQVVAEITDLSFYALFSSEVGAPLIELRASVRLEPEALKVNPGILTAFVSLPEGYPESGIIDAACDGAAYESMQLNEDGTEMAIKFRRQAIEEALAQQGEEIDTHFIVEVTWQGDAGTFIFQGEDDIMKIVN